MPRGYTRDGEELREDVEHLLAGGLTAEQVAARFGIKAASLGRALYRAGHHDLVRPFNVEANRQRTLAKARARAARGT